MTLQFQYNIIQMKKQKMTIYVKIHTSIHFCHANKMKN